MLEGLLLIILISSICIFFGLLILHFTRPSQKVLIDKVIGLMEDPSSWCVNEFVAKHSSGLEIWIANMPVLDTRFHRPCQLQLRINEAWRLHRAVITLRARILLDKTN